MDSQEISSTSNQFIRAEVSARVSGGFENVTVGAATMCFKVAGTTPGTGDFVAAAWEAGGPPYHMRRLSGLLAAGRYDIWTRVVLGTEDVRTKVGVLVVT